VLRKPINSLQLKKMPNPLLTTQNLIEKPIKVKILKNESENMARDTPFSSIKI
jgi:hypothetical protein